MHYNSNKTREEKFYEAIGVKRFKDFLMFFWKKLYGPLYNTSASKAQFSNYLLHKKGNPSKYLPKHYWKLALNTILHILPLVPAIIGVFTKLTTDSTLNVDFWVYSVGLGVGVNSYCIMLQRYNAIRLNRVIKNSKIHEATQREREIA